jgi:hypothetical protein
MIAAQLGLIVVGLLVVALGTLLIRSGRSTRNVIIGDVPGSATQTYAAPPPATSDSPNCDNWTSNSADDSGTGGEVGELGPGWTTGSVGPCDQTRYLICFQAND